MDKFILITGGTKGIGKAVASCLGKAGYNLILTYASDQAAAEEVRSELVGRFDIQVSILRADISDRNTIGVIDSFLEENRLRLDGLVFNAGMTCRDPFEELSFEDWERVFFANIHFPVFLLQKIVGRINKGGSIVFTGSLMGIQPHSVSLAYGVTKSAVHALVKNMVKFLVPYELRVNAVAPGFVDTEWQKTKPAEIRRNIENKVSLGRFCDPDELFYHDNLTYNICGILLLVFANILDCVDGQLARLTGIKSAIGRILDGFAGDIWFASIYIGFALRLSHDYGTDWFFALAVLSGLSHLVQANITDYYKTLHLYFISKDKGSEFQSLEQVEAKHKEMKYGINKFFYFLYRWYTMLQVKATPTLQSMLQNLHAKYGDNIPENIRVDFRKQSRHLMRYIDLLTFNGRTMVMFVIVLTGQVWAYYLYEIIVLNIVLAIVMRKHEKMCASFLG